MIDPAKMEVISTWNTAIAVLDASELKVRDSIERKLMRVAGTVRAQTGLADRYVLPLMEEIGAARIRATKTAFRAVRDRWSQAPVAEDGAAGENPPQILGHSISKWAASIVKDELLRIDHAIRAGLRAGDDSAEIARRVVGSAQLQGCDGATEKTRQHVIALGRQALKGKP